MRRNSFAYERRNESETISVGARSCFKDSLSVQHTFLLTECFPPLQGAVTLALNDAEVRLTAEKA
jgi:hypothetical protein